MTEREMLASMTPAERAEYLSWKAALNWRRASGAAAQEGDRP